MARGVFGFSRSSGYIYGSNIDVFRALYKHSLELPRDEADAYYKHGLHVGCLSNTTIKAANILLDFPAGLIGEQETWRLLMQAKDEGILALIRNPSISDSLLVSLYKRTGVFAQMPEERWRVLVALSSENERLVTKYEYHDSSDSGFWRIQDAIFNLLEAGPVTLEWVRVLYNLLDHLNFQKVHTPERIDHVLARWAKLDDRDGGGNPCGGCFTSLPLKEEFRCLIAAMYAAPPSRRGLSSKVFFSQGNPSSSDVAIRCAYYGKGELTAEQMTAAHEKDKEVYAFAALHNSCVYQCGPFRQLFEEEHLSRDLMRRFRRHSELFSKIGRAPSVPLKHRKSCARTIPRLASEIKTATADISKRLGEVAAQHKKTQRLVGTIFGIIIHIIIIAAVVLGARLTWLALST